MLQAFFALFLNYFKTHYNNCLLCVYCSIKQTCCQQLFQISFDKYFLHYFVKTSIIYIYSNTQKGFSMEHTMNKITHVAIFDPNTNTRYVLPKPFRHHHILHFSGIGKVNQPLQLIEGFEADLKFLTRTEAYILAKANGQLNRRVGAQYYQGPELFSEDLW